MGSTKIKNKLCPGFVIALLCAAIVACSPPTKTSHSGTLPSSILLPVFPRSASSLKPIELSEFIADTLPNKGFENLDWSYLSSRPIQWVTDGYESGGGTETWRWGLVRIRVNGEMATVLRQRKEELAWSVSLITDGSPRFGPTFVRIEPGFDNAAELGLNTSNGQPGICFGSLFSGCNFSADALKSARMSATKICETKTATDRSDIYKIHVAGKQPALLTYSIGGGTGGASASIELHGLADEKTLCSGQ